MTQKFEDVTIEVLEIKETNDSTETETNKTQVDHHDKDIDGGWAWMVLAGAAGTFLVYGGTMKCFGVFFTAFIEQFGSSSSITSTIGGTLHSTYSAFTLPILTVGLGYLTTRQFVVLTSILSSAAYICGSFANRVEILIITNGFMSGLAFACSHGPLMYLLGIYFVKRRNLSQAVAVSGFTFGGLIFPPIYGYFIEKYGLGGGMLLTGAIQLHIIAFAIVCRPKAMNKTKKNLADEEDISCSLLNKEGTDHTSKETFGHDFHDDLLVKQMNGRKRSMSESIPNGKAKKDIIKNMVSSEQQLTNKEYYSSLSKIIDALSHSSIASALSMCDINSLSLFDNQSYASNYSITSDKFKCYKNNLIDLTLFKEGFMRMYAIVFFFGRVPSALFCIFIAPLAKDSNITPNNVAILVSLTNAFDFVGMILCGIITDRKVLKNYTTVIVTLCLISFCMALSPLCKEFWHFVIFSIMTGIGTGGIFALTPSIIADFMGIERFRSSMGLLVLLQGLSLGLSAPFIGFLRDITGTYIASFYLMSGCGLISAGTFIIGLLIMKKNKKT